MKTKFYSVIIAILLNFYYLEAQNTVTVTASNYDISDNLDLEAVASLFGECSSLEEFENQLNNPDLQMSNLDLNEDGYVDYLRVIETKTNGVHLIVVQAILDEDIFQDVATIEVEKDNNGKVVVQIVGDEYLYGSDYIIEPVYTNTVVIFDLFWGAVYNAWLSPFRWNYYPKVYTYHKPIPVYSYRKKIVVHKTNNISYHHTSERRIYEAQRLHVQNRRNDYGNKRPEKSFSNRNSNYKNKQEFDNNRNNNRGNGSQKRYQQGSSSKSNNSSNNNATQTRRDASAKQATQPSTQKQTSNTNSRYNNSSSDNKSTQTQNRRSTSTKQVTQQSEDQNSRVEKQNQTNSGKTQTNVQQQSSKKGTSDNTTVRQQRKSEKADTKTERKSRSTKNK